ncbi:Zinc finger protein 830 [Lamellibrachia satsuma]|nr:Zinc finger protein 830 [Lamellibrachia satsuma]
MFMYNSIGQLTCVLCNCPVKNDLLWTAHVQGRTHRENVTKVKVRKEDVFTKPTAAPPNALKRKQLSDPSDAVVQKVRKGDTADRGSTASASHPHSQVGTSPHACKPTTSSAALPADFFDAAPAADDAAAMETSETDSPVTHQVVMETSEPPAEQLITDESKPMAEKLPEGFFDDPVKDAKVREVEYRNKMDDEWELFQRVMKDESTVSEAIEEEEEEQKTAERNIEEIDEQIHRWSQVDKLQKAKEQLMLKEVPRADEEDQEEEVDEEQEFEEFLDWRSKNAWK